MHDPTAEPDAQARSDRLYEIMKEQTRKTALARLTRDKPKVAAMIHAMAEGMAVAYENNTEKRGDGWMTADPDELVDLLADVSLDHLTTAVVFNGDKHSVDKEAADVALLAAMSAFRTLEIKRRRRMDAGKPFHGRLGVPDYNPNTEALCPDCKAPLWLDGVVPYCGRCDWQEIEGHSEFQEERRFERLDGEEGVRPAGVPGRPETEREVAPPAG